MQVKISDAIATKIRESLGEASMCWDSPDKAGQFRSDEALAISERLFEYLAEADPSTVELVRQMRERASFADTPASLSRLISTWADVLEGKESTGWAAMNREDLREAKELSR